MKAIWTHIAAFLSGIIAGLLLFLKLKRPDTVINDRQLVGKIKQRGHDNEQRSALEKLTGEPSRRDARRAERLIRREERKQQRK